MTNSIYKIPMTLDESCLFGQNKLYVSLDNKTTYTYNQLVDAYKKTEYLSIDDFMIDNQIITYSMLHDGDYGYCDISYITMPDGSLILIVAICN